MSNVTNEKRQIELILISRATPGMELARDIYSRHDQIILNAGTISSSDLALLLVGCVVAFAVSMFIIKFLMSFIKKHDFKSFGVYRIALGILLIILFACGVMSF